MGNWHPSRSFFGGFQRSPHEPSYAGSVFVKLHLGKSLILRQPLRSYSQLLKNYKSLEFPMCDFSTSKTFWGWCHRWNSSSTREAPNAWVSRSNTRNKKRKEQLRLKHSHECNHHPGKFVPCVFVEFDNASLPSSGVWHYKDWGAIKSTVHPLKLCLLCMAIHIIIHFPMAHKRWRQWLSKSA